MRLGAYNVENMFDRAKAMNLHSWSEGRPVLKKFAELNSLLGELNYTQARKRKMVALLKALGLEKSDTGPFVILRRNRGGLVKRPRRGGIQITATGRADWVGSLELRNEPINEKAMRNTARVIADVQADVLGVVEAESRPVLVQFSSEIIPAIGGTPYRHAMLIDGNDDRGIDVGIMTGPSYPIVSMRSHVDDRDNRDKQIFSRDCPEYTVQTALGNELVVLVNHLKSKGYGSPAANDRRRKSQATQIKKVYERLIDENVKFVAVIGDLNDSPDRNPLKPLLSNTDLVDAFEHPQFDDAGFPGTFGSCKTISKKIDFLLLSPRLFERVQTGSVFRKGMWPGVRPRKWECYNEISRPEEAASDHAAIWVDIDV